jgi:serine protease DegQ
VIATVNGNKTKDVKQLLNQIAQIEPGGKVNLKILRKGKELVLIIQAGQRPKPKTLN